MPSQNYKHPLYPGLLLIASAFLYWLLPHPPSNSILIFFNTLFYLGNILFFDAVSFKYSKFSLLSLPDRRKHFLILGLIFGLFLEFYVHWLGKLWYYPYWDTSFYILVFIPGYAAYSFYLLETFLGTKAFLEYIFVKRRKNSINFKGLKHLFTTLGLIGAVGIGSLTTFLLYNFFNHGQNNLVNFFSINKAVPGSPNTVWYMILASIFLWLVLEFFEYQSYETSMLYDLIKGNYWPVIAVFISGWVSAVVYEIFNIPGGLWRYANWPLAGVTVFGIPLIIIFVWPFHYFPMFSLYRLLFKKETEELWR